MGKRVCVGKREEKMPIVPRGFDHVFKVVVVGESGVGKSSLVASFADEPFVEERSATIAADIRNVCITTEDSSKRIKCLVWDTAGQERYRSLTGAYYRGAQLAMLCFDVTNYESFRALSTWVTDLRTNLSTSEHVVVLLVGTKLDRGESKRVVTREEAEAFARSNDVYAYLETSARQGTGVKHAFQRGVERVLEVPELVQTAPAVITLSCQVQKNEVEHKKGGGCCGA